MGASGGSCGCSGSPRPIAGGGDAASGAESPRPIEGGGISSYINSKVNEYSRNAALARAAAVTGGSGGSIGAARSRAREIKSEIKERASERVKAITGDAEKGLVGDAASRRAVLMRVLRDAGLPDLFPIVEAGLKAREEQDLKRIRLTEALEEDGIAVNKAAAGRLALLAQQAAAVKAGERKAAGTVSAEYLAELYGTILLGESTSAWPLARLVRDVQPGDSADTRAVMARLGAAALAKKHAHYIARRQANHAAGRFLTLDEEAKEVADEAGRKVGSGTFAALATVGKSGSADVSPETAKRLEPLTRAKGKSRVDGLHEILSGMATLLGFDAGSAEPSAGSPVTIPIFGGGSGMRRMTRSKRSPTAAAGERKPAAAGSKRRRRC